MPSPVGHALAGVSAGYLGGTGEAGGHTAGRSGWSFTADRAEISLEDSVYLGARAGMRRTEQIVVSGSLQRTPVIGWALRRVEEGG